MKFALLPGSPAGLHLLAVPVPLEARREDARHLVRESLKKRLAELLSIPAADVVLRSSPGQPLRLAEPFSHIGLSISHEPGLSLAAINLGGPVGIDLMRLGALLPDTEALARDYLGPALADAILQQPAIEQAAAFTLAWTAHEACLKCLGLQLTEWTPVLAKSLATCRLVPVGAAPGRVASVAISCVAGQ